MKEFAKEVVRRVEEGEEVTTTSVHISEVLNILEDHLGVRQSMAFLAWILSTRSIRVLPVGVEEYEASLGVAREHLLGLNDSLAIHVMRREGIREIYSMDRDFDGLPGVERLPKP